MICRTIAINEVQLETLYAKWKIQYVKPSPTPQSTGAGLSNAELALIILGSVVALLLLLGLCFAIKTRCRYNDDSFSCRCDHSNESSR